MVRFIVGAWAVGMTLGWSAGAAAQDYPSKTVRIIAGTAGGGNDFQARQIAQGITGALGQQIVVDNRATALVGPLGAKAAPDGYTFFIQGASLWIAPLLQPVDYEMRDFTPLCWTSRDVLILTVHPSLPVKSVKDLIALAKARPGELNYASSSIGGPGHLATELLKSMTGINIVHVPYKGTPPTIVAILAGEVQILMADAGLSMPHIKLNKLRALGVTSSSETQLVPGMPTIASQGVPGYETVGAGAFWFPAKTPPAYVNRISQEMLRFLRQPEVKERFLKNSIELVASTPEELGAFVKADTTKWTKVIKDAGIKLE